MLLPTLPKKLPRPRFRSLVALAARLLKNHPVLKTVRAITPPKQSVDYTFDRQGFLFIRLTVFGVEFLCVGIFQRCFDRNQSTLEYKIHTEIFVVFFELYCVIFEQRIRTTLKSIKTSPWSTWWYQML